MFGPICLSFAVLSGQPQADALHVWLTDPLRKVLRTAEPTADEGERAEVAGYRARIRNHGHSCFLCEIVIRSQFHTTYEPEA
jgi:hypothetical protein